MNRIVYLNGEYVAEDKATISIFDRGILFGDGVYEVAGVLDGKLLDFEYHMSRLTRSLDELHIPHPLSHKQLLEAFRQMVKVNDLDEGLVYLQITRGVEDRDFIFGDGLTPTIFMFTQEKSSVENDYAKVGVSLQSVPDIRWARRDIKSINLLGQVLSKKIAHDAGAYEALMIGPDGYITECGATSFFIVTDNTILTRPLSNDILPGVTRRSLFELCESNEIKLQEQPVTLEDVFKADEAFITGASTYILPVTTVDSKKIGTGESGEVYNTLREIYIQHARDTAI